MTRPARGPFALSAPPAPPLASLPNGVTVVDGSPPVPDPELLAKQIIAMRAAVATHGRDPLSIKIRARPPIIRDSDGNGDLDAALAQLPHFIAAGADVLVFSPFAYCKGLEDFERVIKKLVAAK